MASAEEIKTLEKTLVNEYNRRLDAVWENFIDSIVYPIYYQDGVFTHDEIRQAMGGAFNDQGFEEFDECFGVDDPNEDD